jgi:hypothetical protein
MMVEESRHKRKALQAFNSTFMANIPNVNNPSPFYHFHPISLCNNIYKIIYEISVAHRKPSLSENVSREQMGFLHGCDIQVAIGIAQEVIHSAKTLQK